MRVILDAFGGDNSPAEIIKGAALAVCDSDITVILCGDEEKIKKVMKDEKISHERLLIHHATEVIAGDDDPIKAVRNKKDSSIVSGLNLLKDGGGDVFISAGNTGAVFTAANLIIKRIKGVKRSALAIYLPSEKGPKLMLDAGANVTLSPEYINQLALMGSVYYKTDKGKKDATVGLINIGIEETKGTENLVEAYNLLKNNKDINFKGNCESRYILSGNFDVLVCDGFTGNIILKTIEGVSKTLMSGIKGVMMKSILTKICSLGLKKGLYEFKKQFDYKEYGATPIIGLRQPVMKAHGSSDAKAIKNAILNCRTYVQSDIIANIEEKIVDIKVDL